MIDTRDIKIYVLYAFNEAYSLYFKLYSTINILNKKNTHYYVTSMDTCVKTHTCEKYINFYSRIGKTIHVYFFLAWKFLLVFLLVISVSLINLYFPYTL